MSYIYRHVTVEKIIDGDSVGLAIDMGNKITWHENFRLYGIDAPEKKAEGHAEATAYLAGLLAAGVSRIETYKPDKYGRWLADIYVPVSGGELLVNRAMVTDGYAVEYFGGKKQ